MSMRQRTMSWAGLLAIIGVGCARQPDLSAERAALLSTDKEWAAAAASGDVERTVSYWTDDAILLPAGTRPLVGKEAIREFVAASFRTPGFSVSWESTEPKFATGRDLAYMVGRNKFTVRGPDGNLVTTTGNAVSIWRKEPDGAWRCVIDIGNADPPGDVPGGSVGP